MSQPPGWNVPANFLASETAWATQAGQNWSAPPGAPPPGAPPAGPPPPFSQFTSYTQYAPYPQYSAPPPQSGGCPTWARAQCGEIPPGAVAGGYDNGEQLYVGRAHHAGALLPGKVVPSHGACYVAWGGKEHGMRDYEVLCGCNVMWVPFTGNGVPPGSLPSGETEEGEPLFVGRVHQDTGTLTIGKVQESHRVCYIPYGGQEIAYGQFEVLVPK